MGQRIIDGGLWKADSVGDGFGGDPRLALVEGCGKWFVYMRVNKGKRPKVWLVVGISTADHSVAPPVLCSTRAVTPPAPNGLGSHWPPSTTPLLGCLFVLL